MIKVTTRRTIFSAEGSGCAAFHPILARVSVNLPYDIDEGQPIRLPPWLGLSNAGSNAMSKARSRSLFCKPPQSSLSKALMLTKSNTYRYRTKDTNLDRAHEIDFIGS